MNQENQEPRAPITEIDKPFTQLNGPTGDDMKGVGGPPLTHIFEKIRVAATRYERCCDLWQDSLGGMHCAECAQKTFAMLREVQEVLGVGKDCQPDSEPGSFALTARYNDNGEFGAATG